MLTETPDRDTVLIGTQCDMEHHLALEARHRERGAAFTRAWDVEVPRDFGQDPAREHRAVRDACGLLDQSYRGVLDFASDRAADFLERLVSTHAADLGERQGQESCLLSAKGRLLAAFQLFRVAAGRFRAVLAEPMREAVLAAFKKYAFLDDVQVLDQSVEIAVLSVQGPLSGAALEAASAGLGPVGALPPERLGRGRVQVGGVDIDVVRAGETSESGYEVWAPRARVEAVWDALLARVEERGGCAVGWTAAEALRIEAGLTHHGFDYDEESFPMEVNHGHRLVYDKCYVGQEVVARMRTYGHVNRCLFFASGAGLRPGAKVLSGVDLAGRITSSCYSFRWGKPLAFALISRKYWTNRELRLEDGTAVEIAALPEQKG